MKYPAVVLPVLLAVLLTPAIALGDIQEVADAAGNVTHYKYTDKRGSLVFTDSLASIPEEVRKKNKVVRIGPPRRKEAPAEQKPVAETPVPVAPALPQFQVKPEAAPAADASTGGYLWVIAVAALGAAAAGYFVYRRHSDGRPGPRTGGGPAGRERGGAAASDSRRPSDGQGPRSEERATPREKPEEVLQRYLQARDYASAARLSETLGELGQAAAYHQAAGNAARARDLYLELKDYRRAAELFEKGGEDLKAAELYEAAFRKEGHDPRGAAAGENAQRAGRLYEKAGAGDKAAAMYLKAGMFHEAAAIFEAAQDFVPAAENYLKAGDAAKAAACFEKGGDPVKGYATLSRFNYERGLVKEAALYAEKAGDLLGAATMLHEGGDFARAGELFFQAGSYGEAAENFSLANDAGRAGEAYERAGNYLQAAQAFEPLGIDRERLATLYEKGGDFHAAGRLFVKLGQLDKALNVLQQVDPAASGYTSASLLVGMIFLKRGQTDLAREKFLKIIDNKPVGKANLEPYYFLALCQEHAGDAESAKAIFSKILAEDYNYRDVRKRLAPK